MGSQKKKQDTYDLLLHLLENDLSDSQRDYLIEWSQKDPDAVTIYHDFLRMYSMISLEISSRVEIDYGSSSDTQFDQALWATLLEHEKTAPAIKMSEEQQPELIQKVIYPQQEKREISKLNIITFAVSAAAILFLVLFVKFVPHEGQPIVARVSETVDAEWLSVSGQIADGSDLYPGPLTLKKGCAEILLNSGAHVLLEAPVEFDLETASSLYLREGRLVANIEQSTEQRFVVRTVSSTVVDYGTQFGVEVDTIGRTYAHVFKGKVELRQGSDPLKYQNKLQLEAGQSGRAGRSGELLRVNAEPQRFIDVMPTRYELAVRKTQPLYYWRFDRDREGTFQYELDSGLNHTYQLVGTIGYTDGPDLRGSRPNTALQLTGPEDYAILRGCTAEADNADSFTIAIWIRPEVHKAAPARKVIIRVRKKDDLGDGHRSTILFDEITKQFLFYVGHTSENTEEPAKQFATNVSSEIVELDAWYHVVATYKNNERMHLYVNGQLMASKILPAAVRSLDLDNNDAELYRWLVGFGKAMPSEDIEEDKSFAGSVDEICQYNRVLSAEEVGMLYEAAKGKHND